MNRPGRVLVVDDDPAMLVTLEAVLSSDFEVTIAANASEAEAVLKKNETDVVLTDYDMPGRSGLALIRTIEQAFPATMVMPASARSQSLQLAVASASGPKAPVHAMPAGFDPSGATPPRAVLSSALAISPSSRFFCPSEKRAPSGR